jgi:glycerophosphoryl diester phosphodiesterase
VHGDHCLRIGHGGASALARANTLASFDAAVDVGVDMIEFDVRAHRGELVLAHTVFHSRGAGVRLPDALAYLSSPRFAEVGINLDVKHVGCEAALLDALGQAGLLDRALVSSQVAEVLDRMRARSPHVLTGISIGGRVARASRRSQDWRADVLSGLACRRWDVVMAQHRLVNAALLEDVAALGGRLYAWTVNERGAIESLRGLGVHGIATSDPRLFLP